MNVKRYYTEGQRSRSAPEDDAPNYSPELGVTEVGAWRIVDRSRNRVVAVCPDVVVAHKIEDLLNAAT